MYQDNMVMFLWDKFKVLVTTFSISRALVSALRCTGTIYNLIEFCFYHLVYIDESRCDKRIITSGSNIAQLHRGYIRSVSEKPPKVVDPAGGM